MPWENRNRVELASISSLTLYKDKQAVGRRSTVPQLTCQGKPCRLFQPEVVYCRKLPGGSGTDIDWKCEADLPDSLRFGKIQVSCEGWSGPGDPYVVKGSCSLDYRLVQIPGALRNDNVLRSGWGFNDLISGFFVVLWGLVLFYIIYSFCIARNRSRSSTSTSRPSSGPRPGGGNRGTYGSGPSIFPDTFDDPPPPYSANYKPPNSSNQGWRPGFWTGAAVGGLATHLFSRRRQPPPPPAPTPYDWERQRSFRMPFFSRFNTQRAPVRPNFDYDDRGEGPSNLGSMRRSTGFSGTNVR
ncbi:hypothetical protein AMATHDRAFT_138919 [Amanita thiersii Skay4041]|uniref:Store-operated calcium entry-associated regulatory factor n=1 Tax=Amanita thiersii Skay4041 TaxID=703135 RepID=A0A2A9NPW9_9AGAR|nr:hypothetical protein AMATHDRAFT_138919 [Amanita thiersii Skay4041]